MSKLTFETICNLVLYEGMLDRADKDELSKNIKDHLKMKPDGMSIEELFSEIYPNLHFETSPKEVSNLSKLLADLKDKNVLESDYNDNYILRELEEAEQDIETGDTPNIEDDEFSSLDKRGVESDLDLQDEDDYINDRMSKDEAERIANPW